MNIIEAAHVEKFYTTRRGSQQVLSDINFTMQRGKILSVFGPNGSGKSTLMSLLAGLDAPDSGKLTINLKRAGVVPVIFQDFRRSLFPWLSVKANILFPLRLAGLDRRSQEHRLDKLCSVIQPSFGLEQRVSELSGGEAQLTSLLRGLIVEPELLICDEPTSALDYHASLMLIQQLLNAAATLALSIVFVGHDLDEVIYVGDEVIFLSKRPGHIIGHLNVDLPRPRHVGLQTTAEFAAAKQKALKLAEIRTE